MNKVFLSLVVMCLLFIIVPEASATHSTGPWSFTKDYEDFNWAGNNGAFLESHSYWARLSNSVGSSVYAQYRNGWSGTMPAGSDDNWFAGSRWTGGATGVATYAFNGALFAATEGYEYTLEAKVASRSDGASTTELMAHLGIMEADGATDVYENWTRIASIESAYGDLSLNAYDADTQVSTVTSPSDTSWYDIKMVVQSLAGQADQASYYYRVSGAGSWTTLIENEVLANDLNTGSSLNRPVIGLWMNTNGDGKYSAVDHVRITETLIPEPATISMLMFGAGVLLRRKRSR